MLLKLFSKHSEVLDCGCSAIGEMRIPAGVYDDVMKMMSVPRCLVAATASHCFSLNYSFLFS